MSDNTKKAQCIHCFHFFSKDSNSTLKNHISHPHCEALKRVSKSRQSSMSRDRSIFVYNPDVLREHFAGLVIQRGLPFNHFDDEQTTRVFKKHLQPKYNHLLISWVFGKQRNQCFQFYPTWPWIISVQATSVASESAFSKSGRVLSIRRTRLTPASLEMCMCLKDHLDAQKRKQHKSGLENPIDFKEEFLDAESRCLDPFRNVEAIPHALATPWRRKGVPFRTLLYTIGFVPQYYQEIMKYLVKISKKARILVLKRRHLKITVLTSNTPYPSRKIRRNCACTSLKTRKE
ncbi:zinc finger BED domain-containing protein RICESLEEPER 2 [Tanacetum coccineum]